MRSKTPVEASVKKARHRQIDTDRDGQRHRSRKRRRERVGLLIVFC